MQAGLAAPAVASLLFAAVAVTVLAWPAPALVSHAAFRLPPARSGDRSPEPAGRPEPSTDAILARPLFSMSRRPPAEDSGAGVSAALPRLSGIVVIGPFRHAVFETASPGKPVAVGIGDHAGPYLVRAISDNAVTVLGADGEKTLRPAPLPSDEESAANSPPTGAPPPPYLPAAFANPMIGHGPPGQHTPSPLDNLLARLRQRH